MYPHALLLAIIISPKFYGFIHSSGVGNTPPQPSKLSLSPSVPLSKLGEGEASEASGGEGN